jgi:hypothetical protein
LNTLCKELCNAIEDRDDLTFSKVAEYIGASKQCMSKFKSKGEIGFRKLLRLSYLMFPSNQKEVMSGWCLRLISVESIKQSFEYAAITRNVDLLGNLITKHKKEKGILSECVAVYSIIYGYMTDEISGFDLIAHLKKYGQIKDESLKILVDIIKCYNYFFQKKFHLMLETAHEAEQDLANLGNRELFIKESYLHRIAEVLDSAYLFLNNLPLARHYAFIIINADICPKTVSDASYIIGMSYLLEDERKCLEYLQRSYDIAKTIQDKVIENEARLHLDFVKLYLEVELDADSAKELISYQNNKDSEINLKSLKEVMYLKGEDDLLVLFEAMEEGSVSKLHEHFLSFFQQSNFFFASLFAKELQKKGDNSIWVTQALQYTIKTEESGYFEKDFISGFIRHNDSSERSCA